MEQNETVLVRVARILAISGVAAGVAGGLAGRILSGRRASEPRKEVLRARSGRATKEAGRRLKAASSSDPAKALRESIGSVVGSTRHDIERWSSGMPTTKEASELADRLRAAAVEGKDKASGIASELINEAADYVSQVEQQSKGTRKRVVKKLDRQRHEAEDHARKLRKQSGEHIADLEKYVSETLDDRVKPTLAKAGKSAGHAAEELRTRLSDQLDHLADVAEEQRPHLAAAAEAASSRISQLIKDADAASDDWRDTAERAVHEAEGLIQDNARVAREFAGDVGESAKRGTRDFGSLIFWLMVAGGLVYAVLLNDEQKRKARNLAESAFREGRDLYRDMQGRNTEFDAQ